MEEQKPLSEPEVDKEGLVYADEGPFHYIVIERPDGTEKKSVTSNAIFMLHSLAEAFATETPGFTDTVRIVRGDTHEAVFRYEEGKGLQEGWQENDPERAECRRRAWESDQKIITFPK